VRGNYRIASDRIATFLFGSSIFQSTPGKQHRGRRIQTSARVADLYRDLDP
jgi:hypothetical protein